MMLARWRKSGPTPGVSNLRSHEPRAWRVVAPIEVTSKNGERLIVEPPTALTYEDRTHHRDAWNTKAVEWTRHVFSLPDGRRVYLMETWDETDEEVMIRTGAFPPVGLESVPVELDDD
jgi:hypothetical protein